MKVGLPRTTVWRVVASLESEALLTPRSLDGRSQLGMELVSLAAAVRHDLRRELRPYLEALLLQVDEAVDLALLDKDHVLFLDQVTRLKRLRAVSGVGVTFPLHCTANGKALLAALPPESLEALLPEDLPRFRANTLTTRAQQLEALTAICAEGVAYDREEHTLGICAVGAAVRAPTDTLVAITIPVPSVRFFGNEARFAEALLRTCELISQAAPDRAP